MLNAIGRISIMLVFLFIGVFCIAYTVDPKEFVRSEVLTFWVLGVLFIMLGFRIGFKYS